MNETHTNGSLDAELQQLSIYNEMRQRNQMTEMYRHMFNVLGSIISVCGIIGITNRFIYFIYFFVGVGVVVVIKLI